MIRQYSTAIGLLGFLLLSSGLSGQVMANGSVTSGVTGSNVLFDASTGFSKESGAGDYVGKGIVIPSVDLVNFEFDLTLCDGFTFPTYFDGMIVYNNSWGNTLTSGNRPSTSTQVSPGYYYFSNPNGYNNGSVTQGEWKPIGEGSTSFSWYNSVTGQPATSNTQSIYQHGNVGIYTDKPKATLDVSAGKSDGSTAEGIIAPRMRGDEIKFSDSKYDVDQKGAIVYATMGVGIPSAKTVNITSAGYYYFDGSIWQKFGSGSGSYTGSGTITLNGNSFERAALTGDVTSAANSNTTTISNNAVTSAKILDGSIATSDLADGSVTGAKLSQMSASSGQVLKWDGSSWVPGTPGGLSTTLTSGRIYVGNASNVATAVVPTGDVTIDTTGNTTINTNTVTSDKIYDGSVGNADLAVGAGGLYKGSGTISGNTTVAQGSNTLSFTTSATNGFSVDGTTLSVDAANDRLGVGTVTPKVTLDVTAKTTDGSAAEGFKAPMLTGNALHIADTNGKYGAAQNSAIVYVTTAADADKRVGQTEYVDSRGFYYFDTEQGTSGKWMKLGTGGSVTPTIGSLDCSGNLSSGQLSQGVAASGVSSVIPYTGGNGAAYNAQDILSTGVTGLIAHLSAGSLSNGNGSLSYTITGTPSGTGTASFPLSIGGQSCTLTRDVILPAVISSLDCSGATNSGTLTAGTSSSGVSSVISYTGGNSGTYSSQTINSTGVTGLTATLSAGTLASGSGSLTYTITGTPSGGGTASFAISIGGQSCTLTRTVAATPITIPATITLAQNRAYMLASVYDQDYLPYTAPTGAATTATQVADGVNESVTVNVQGSITTTGVTLSIPATATGDGTLLAFSQTITIPSGMTEDGISRDLMFSWTSQAYTSSTTSITATIKSVGGTLNAKKLDINAGIGKDALGVLLGQFNYPYNNAGNTTTYSIRDIAVIPDKMFEVADNTGSTTTHQMLYLPIMAEDGKTWLNNNLGADYANINKASFNPSQQATGAMDYNAYGSLFQWGRKPDGHELINWTSGTTGTPVNGTTTTRSNNPANALFITSYSSNGDWRTTQDDSLWATAASANNPCPSGFRVPTVAEQDTLVASAGITDSATAAGSVLKFTVSGGRNSITGSFESTGSYGIYWSSSVNGTDGSIRYFGSGVTAPNINLRGIGFSVRCLKD